MPSTAMSHDSLSFAVPHFKRRDPDEIAVVTAERTVRVGEVLAASAPLAADIAKASQQWRVAGSARALCCVLPSSDPVDFLIGLVACAAAGATVIPWRDTTLPLDDIISPIRPEALIRFPSKGGLARLDRLTDLNWTGDGAGQIIMMTSGSTGEPKGVALDLSQIALNCISTGSTLEIWNCDGWVIDIDMALTSATCHMIMAWQFSLPLYHFATASEEVFKSTFRSNKKLGYGASPVQLVRMIERLDSHETPAMMVSSGDFLTPPMVDKLFERFPRTQIHKLYGLTELGGRFCCMPHRHLIMNKAAAGRPLPGFSARLADEDDDEGPAEIEASSPLLFRGYYMPGGQFVPREDDWFRTGDIGTIDEDGVVTLVGRADDVLKVGGEKVDRQSIELCLSELLKGHEYCVLGVRHHLIGQVPALFISPDRRYALAPKDDIIGCVRAALPPRFIPALVYVIEDALPRLANGKIDRVTLKTDHQTFAHHG